MKICHIKIEDFRSIETFDEDVGMHNIIIGKNNTGKSNLLWAIYYFYNPKNISAEDFIKRNDDEENKDEFFITLTFDDLTNKEQANNRMYYINGKIEIRLNAWIDSDNKVKFEHHGFTEDLRPIYPPNFDENTKELLENVNPKRADFNNNVDDDLTNIMQDIVPKGNIKKEDMKKIKQKYFASHSEIQIEKFKQLSETKYQGFIKTYNPKNIGECYFIPAIKDPKDELQTEKTTSPMYQMIESILSEFNGEEIKNDFKRVQDHVKDERLVSIENIKTKFNEELELFNTTVEIQLIDIEIEEAFPLKLDIAFNDGVATHLDNKGTGLQRYALFKFLKIKNELNLGLENSYILLFEEPEAHLHPQFQKEIAKILKEISERPNYQTFITTHSPHFIDLLNLDYIFLFNKVIDCTKSKKCELNLIDIKKKINTMVMFDANVKELFFSDKIVLVEGPSEEVISNILIQEGEIDVSNVSIIQAKSKHNIPLFISVFNSIKIPYCVLIDEDPYFLPKFTKKDPSKIKGKKDTYNKTKEIADLIDDSLGKMVVISPNLDEFLGVSKTRRKKLGKPTAIYKKYMELKEKNSDIINKVKDIFNLLINSNNLNFKVSKIDKTKWEYKEENSVVVPEANFNDLKEALKGKIKLYDKVYKNLSSDEINELKSLLNPNKPKSKLDTKQKLNKSNLGNWLCKSK